MTSERQETIYRLARASDILDRLVDYAAKPRTLVRRPAPAALGLVAYEMDMGRLMADSVSRLSLSVCEMLDAIAPLLDELERLVSEEGVP